MDQVALLMPWFQSPRRAQGTLDAVAKMLKEDLRANGFRHGDIAWRNVGVYHADGELRAIMFVMQSVEPCEADVDWVTPALASLAKKWKFHPKHQSERDSENRTLEHVYSRSDVF